MVGLQSSQMPAVCCAYCFIYKQLGPSKQVGILKDPFAELCKSSTCTADSVLYSLSMSAFEKRWLPRYGKWSTFSRHSFAIVVVGGGAKVSGGGWWRTWVFLMFIVMFICLFDLFQPLKFESQSHYRGQLLSWMSLRILIYFSGHPLG